MDYKQKNNEIELKNENEQLKKVNEYQRKAIESVKKQYKELELWKQEWQDAQIKANEEGFARTMLQIKNKELEKENAELKEQIEKMKCCGNCKHENDSNTNYYCEECKRFANETDVDKWE